MGSTRYGNFRADDIERARTRLSCALLGDPRQPRGPLGNNLVGQRNRAAGAGHAAVEVNLEEPGLDVTGHQHRGSVHGLLGPETPPAVGPQMVSAQHDSFPRQAETVRRVEYDVAEVRRPHARVAAELVDLVRRRLQQQRSAVVEGLQHRRLDHQWMHRADRSDANRRPGTVAPDKVEQKIVHGPRFAAKWPARCSLTGM
jgi:hypothetical protein